MLRAARFFVLGLGLFAVTLTTGCNTITSADIRDDPTPELYSQAMSLEEYKNDRAIHRHHAWRTIHDDLARLFLFDKNTQLTPWPTP
ncbi:MAG: hypothetical protein ACIAXF_00540 [Phycisphaerales bacterium JB063]